MLLDKSYNLNFYIYLNINRDIFGEEINEALLLFPTCFPSLSKLHLRHLQIVPNDIVVQLSKLEFLEELEIVSIREPFGFLECPWNDNMFMLPCESQRSRIGSCNCCI